MNSEKTKSGLLFISGGNNCQEKVKVEKSKGMLSNFLGLNLGSSNTKEK